MGYLELDVRMLMRYNPSDVEFTENGKIGWKTKSGKILIPAEYDQIEKCADSLYVRKGNQYELYRSNGSSEAYHHDYEDGSFFVKNQKFGWKKMDKVFIPAKYDEIHSWSDNLFPVRKDGRYYYINDKEEEVLTNVRHFANDEKNFLFESCSHDKEVLTIHEYVGHQVKNDPNVVKIGSWVRLDRISNNEIIEMLVNNNDEAPITEKDLEDYNSKFSYEFSVYVAKSKATDGTRSCLDKMRKMDAHCNSWFYIIKVWKAIGEEPTAEELRNFRYYMASKDYLGNLVFGLGHDASLKPGETKMLMVTHYNEECFPPSFQFEWYEYLKENTLEEIKERMLEQRNTVEGHVFPEYVEEVWANHFTGEIAGICYYEGRSWEETARVLDFLKQYDNSYTYAVKGTVDSLFNYFELNSKEEDEFYLHKLEWLLENGSDVNAHKDNKTALDLIREYQSEKKEKYNDESIERCLKLLHQYGVKSMKEIMKEEIKNNDYRKELKILNGNY